MSARDGTALSHALCDGARRGRSQASRGALCRLRRFVRERGGFAAAESVLLALVLCGMCLMVAKTLLPGTRKAARNLQSELSGSATAARR